MYHLRELHHSALGRLFNMMASEDPEPTQKPTATCEIIPFAKGLNNC